MQYDCKNCNIIIYLSVYTYYKYTYSKKITLYRKQIQHTKKHISAILLYLDRVKTENKYIKLS